MDASWGLGVVRQNLAAAKKRGDLNALVPVLALEQLLDERAHLNEKLDELLRERCDANRSFAAPPSAPAGGGGA